MWYGKYDYELDDDYVSPTIINKTISLQEIKKELDNLILKKSLEEHFTEVLKK